MKNYQECGKPLFDQDYADPTTGLCDECYREQEELETNEE